MKFPCFVCLDAKSSGSPGDSGCFRRSLHVRKGMRLIVYAVHMSHFAVDREHRSSGPVIYKQTIAILINLFLNKSSEI